uniref:hypothetical protein n=1 Tax=Cellulomonas iranensis TaxID=76862 RepID=UPI001C4FFAEC
IATFVSAGAPEAKVSAAGAAQANQDFLICEPLFCFKHIHILADKLAGRKFLSREAYKESFGCQTVQISRRLLIILL